MNYPYDFKLEDAERFARERGIPTKIHGHELIFARCPFCQGKTNPRNDREKFSINTETGQYHCFRASCKASGNMYTLASSFDFSLSKEIDAYLGRKKQFRSFKKPEKPIVPKSAAVEYLESRGISKAIAERYEITTCNGRDNILVFPFYDEKGNLVSVKYRKTDFDKEKDNAKEWFEKGCKPILFGMKQCESHMMLVLTEGQCFDGKAEILTPNGWMRLEDYDGSDVLQVDKNLNGTFVRPRGYIVKRYSGNMVRVRVGGNYETYTTEDHDLVYENKKGELVKEKAINHVSGAWHVPTAISINSGEMSQWTDDMFALYLAISADGTIDYRKGTGHRQPESMQYARIAIPLKRKYDRLIGILDRLGLSYSDNTDSRNYHSVCFPCPDWLTTKYLPYEFATKTTIEQKRFIISEMVHWDGNTVKGRAQFEYTTVLKHNADVMQLIATSCGYMSTIVTKENGGNGNYKKSYCYKVNVLLNKKNVSTQRFDTNKEIIPVDQRVYCVTVDTGMILARQNNKISVTGNCDTLAVAESGIGFVVSVPTGANGFTWVPYCWNWVNQFERIVVFGDHEKGRITLLDEISRRFPLEIYHVREEDYKDCKDANEILLKYGKEQVRKCVNNAVPIPVEDVIELADVEDVDIFKIEKLPTGIRSLDRLLYGGIPFGGVILVSGKSGQGKSTLASQIIVNARENGYKCFAYSGELPNYLFKAWMDFQVAGRGHIFEYQDSAFGDTNYNVSKTNRHLISEWYRGNVFLFDNRKLDGQETQSLLKITERVIQQYGVKVILLDNLMTAMTMDRTKGADQYERQTDFVNKLRSMAVKYNVVILLVAHKRKNGLSVDENDEIAGSSNIANLAMLTITYGRDSEIGEDQRLLKVPKNRLFGRIETKGFLLNYDEKSKRIYGEGDDLDKEYSWNDMNGFVPVDATDVVFD